MPDSTLKLNGVRGVIARKMQTSLADHAQLSYHSNIDATAMVALKTQLQSQGVNVSFEDILIDVTASVLAKHPEHNGWLEEKLVYLSEQVHMGVAVATTRGLMVPVVRDVGSLSIGDISSRRRQLVAMAQAGKLAVKDMTGGSFTISNLGQTSIDHFTPIINTPQIAILGIGRIIKRAHVSDDGNIIARPEMGLSLTVDHRVVDGWPSGQFLSALCEALESLLYSDICTLR